MIDRKQRPVRLGRCWPQHKTRPSWLSAATSAPPPSGHSAPAPGPPPGLTSQITASRKRARTRRRTHRLPELCQVFRHPGDRPNRLVSVSGSLALLPSRSSSKPLPSIGYMPDIATLPGDRLLLFSSLQKNTAHRPVPSVDFPKYHPR